MIKVGIIYLVNQRGKKKGVSLIDFLAFALVADRY